MTRLALPVEDFVLWAERLADLDWPISGEDFPQTISKFGWAPSDMQNQFVTGIGGQSDLASFHTNYQGVVKDVRLNLTETLLGEGNEPVINDWFVTYVAAGKEAFGKPSKMVPGMTKRAWWERPNGAVISLVAGSFGVSLKIISPQGVEYI